MLASEHSSWERSTRPSDQRAADPIQAHWSLGFARIFSSGVCAWAAFHTTSCTYSLTM